MQDATIRQLSEQARAAGYTVQAAERVRTNRWVLSLLDQQARTVIVLVQQRRMVTAADVQDLAEIVQLRRAQSGVLVAQDGGFSPIAQHTARELLHARIRLCTEFPHSDGREPSGLVLELANP